MLNKCVIDSYDGQK